jgi:hydroxyacyl-ACP dehydratase HTD2-like protein with hotdog domain
MLARPTTAIFDNLTPTPSHLLTITLSDFLPKQCWPADFDAGRPRLPATAGSTAALPQGHHLVYFAPQLAGSQLMADGTDPAHSPGKPWSRRLWAGGSLSFAKGWEEKLKLDGRRAVCIESIGDVNVRGKGVETRRGIGDEQMLNGHEKVFVDVVRKYRTVEGAHSSEDDSARSAAKDDLRAMTQAKYDPAIEEVRTLAFMAEKYLGDSQILRGLFA